MFLRAVKNIAPGDEITWNYGRDYYLNVITPRGCKCDRCRSKRLLARRASRARRARGGAQKEEAVARSVGAQADRATRRAP